VTDLFVATLPVQEERRELGPPLSAHGSSILRRSASLPVSTKPSSISSERERSLSSAEPITFFFIFFILYFLELSWRRLCS
jgi:hypothetical protein